MWLWVAEESGEVSAEALHAFPAEHHVRGIFPAQFLGFLHFLELWGQPERVSRPNLGHCAQLASLPR